METFNYKLTTESSGEIEHKVNETSFGDGYVQATSIGINNKIATWAITAVGKSSYTRPIMSFIDRHKGALSFYWTPPEGEQGRYRVSKYKLQNIGGNNFRVSATFTQSYGIDAKSASGSAVLSVNGEVPDEYGDVKLTASDLGAEVEGAASEAITELKKEENPFPKYALAENVPDVSEVNKKLDNINLALTDIDTDVGNLQSGLSDTNDYVAEVHNELEAVSDELFKTKDNVTKNTKDIRELETNVNANEKSIAATDKAMVKSVNSIKPDPETGNVEVGSNNVEINDEEPSTETVFSGQKTTDLMTDLKKVVDKKATIDDEESHSDKTVFSGQKTTQLIDAKFSKLSNSNNEKEGAALVAYNQDLDYPDGTIGGKVKNLSESANLQRFTIIYPNGGTEEKPANVTANNRYVMSNPFPGEPVMVVAEIFINGVWGDPGWLWSQYGWGTKASHILESDLIIVQTGSGYVNHNLSSFIGSPHGTTGNNGLTAAPCRVKVWRV